MITQVRLMSFQSWDDITIDLATDRLNVLVAQNETGKSVFFKALKFVGSPKYFSREDRKDYIRFGASHATVGLQFDSGNLVLVQIYPEQVIYDYIVEGKERQPTLEPPPEMLEEAGILVRDDGKFIANIIDEDQELILVNSNLASNFELIRMIVMCDDLDELIEKVEGLQKEFVNYRGRIGDQKAALKIQLDGMQSYDVAKMEHEVKVDETCFGSLKALCEISKNLEAIERVPWRDFEGLSVLLKVLEDLVSIRSVTEKVQEPKAYVSEEFLKVLEDLSEIQSIVGKVSEKEEPKSGEVFSVLEVLGEVQEQLRFVCIESKDFDMIELGAKVHTMLCGIKGELERVVAAGTIAIGAQRAEEELSVELLSLGEVLDCPVYGKVVYDGKKCVDCS